MPDEPTVYIFTRAWAPDGSDLNAFALELDRSRIAHMLDCLNLARVMKTEHNIDEVVQYDYTGEFLVTPISPELEEITDEERENLEGILENIMSGYSEITDGPTGALIEDISDFISVDSGSLQWHYFYDGFARCEGVLELALLESQALALLDK